MAAYNITADGSVLRVAFGDPAQNDEIVRAAQSRLDEMKAAGELPGGPIVKINGPASLPVAVVLAHGLVHLYEAIGVFDPKLGKYVIAVSHGGAYKLGDLID